MLTVLCYTGVYPEMEGTRVSDKLLDASGAVIAWWSNRENCENEKCRKAIAEGRPIHLIPAHTDPRAVTEAVHLVLPTYHFATLEEAATTLEVAWLIAPVAETVEGRDFLYRRNIPVKVAHGIK